MMRTPDSSGVYAGPLIGIVRKWSMIFENLWDCSFDFLKEG